MEHRGTRAGQRAVPGRSARSPSEGCRQHRTVVGGGEFPLAQLESWLREKLATNPSELRAFIQGGRDTVLDNVIERAIDRGEITPDQISERVARLPVDLFRHELLMTLKPITDEAIEEIVDTIFVPLVRLRATAK